MTNVTRVRLWFRRQGDVLALTFFAGALVFWGIGKKSLWLDETLSLSIVTSWQHLWSIAAKSEPYQWSYLTLLYFWQNWGIGEGYLRSLSALFAIATIPVVFILGRLLFDRRIGLLAAALLAVNMFFIRYGQEVRGASMLLFFTAVGSYYFAGYLLGRGKRWLIGYVVFSIAALYTHHFALFSIAAQYATLIGKGTSRQIRNLIIALALILFAAFPLLRIPIPQSAISWISRSTLVDLVEFLIILAGGHWLLLFFAGSPVCITVLNRLMRSRREKERWATFYVLMLLVVPIAGSFVFSFFITPMFVPRYLIATLVPWSILIAAGVFNVSHVFWRRLSAIVIVFISLLSILTWYRSQDTLLRGFIFVDKEDWRGATFYLLSHSKPTDAVVFYAYFTDTPFSYYLASYARTHADFSPPQLVNISSALYTIGGILPPPDDMLIRSLQESYPRVWLVRSHDRSHALSRDTAANHIQKMLEEEYGYERTREFLSISVTLYARSGSDMP